MTGLTKAKVSQALLYFLKNKNQELKPAKALPPLSAWPPSFKICFQVSLAKEILTSERFE